jgi:membrane-associated protease RseP (regulator of RpoE activity)
MKKTFFWAVTALALLPGAAERAAAQATGDVESTAETSVLSDGTSTSEAATGAADAATDSVSETATGQNDAQPAPTAPAAPAPTDATSPDAQPLPQAEADPNPDANATSPSADANAAANASIDGTAAGRAGLDARANPANVSAGLEFGQATQRGLALNRVATDSFFYNSGLRQGDVLVSYGGRPVRSQADFSRWAVYQPGQRIPVVVLRDGREETIFVTYDQNQANPIQRQAGYAPQPGGAYLGVTFDPQSNRGAVVRSVAPGSPAENAGIRPGNVIVAVNDRRVSTYQDVIDSVAAIPPGQELDLVVVHRLTLSARPAQSNYAPQTSVGVESSVITQSPPVGVPSGVVPATRVTPGAVARPGDADRDGRVLDGDGRVGPLERAGRR